MGMFERYLAVWVGMAIVVGVVLGSVMSPLFVLVTQLASG